jgi:hypothetical protein
MDKISLPEGMMFPKYRSHKVVCAAQITNIRIVDRDINNGCIIELEGIEQPVHVSKEAMDRYEPRIGGYLVQYADDYVSFSPEDAFKEGYTRIQD